jgi:predicted negative regulator of RcsB-dependent stress response
MMDKIKNALNEVEHYWKDHKKVVIVFGIILVVAIIM